MNISYNWLQEYLPEARQIPPRELANILTSLGLEVASVEQIEAVPGGLQGVVVGHVLTCVDHPNSDHLHICTVDVGTCSEEPLQIVCGAPNVAAGQRVLVAMVGTTLYAEDGTPFKIKKSKLRGEVSMGMICSQVELHLGTDHSGIWVLEDPTIAPGTPAAEYLSLESDTMIEIDITPNRVDATSIYGVARDLAAYLSYQRRDKIRAHRPELPETLPLVPGGTAAQVIMEVNEQDVPRYQAVTLRGLQNRESPEWLKKRITAIGLHPINAIVDVTNYVLHEIGQPLHAFDLSQISGETLRVAHLPAGTPFTPLFSGEIKLTGAEIMICDEQYRPLCIGGVMGGNIAEVTMATTEVILEAANFNPTTTRCAARSHGLSSDSSFRFERGLSAEATDWALRRAALLIQEICGGEIVGPVVDHYRLSTPPVVINLHRQEVCDIIGVEITYEDLHFILEALDMQPEEVSAGEELRLTLPAYRYDVTRPIDVIEEVLRIYGYNSIPLSGYIHANLSMHSPEDYAYRAEIKLSELLTGLGYQEILCNSLTGHSPFEGQTACPVQELVMIENPLSQELDTLRPTLLIGGLETIARNLNRKHPLCALYEWGNVYSFTPQTTPTTALDQYNQRGVLGLWLTGTMMTGSWTQPAQPTTPYMLKGVLTHLLAHVGITERDYEVRIMTDDRWSDVVGYYTQSGQLLAQLGVVSDYWLQRCDINQPVYYAEVDRDVLMTYLLEYRIQSCELSKYPIVKRDLAMLVDEELPYNDLVELAHASERKLLKRVELFDVYTGRELPAGKKSYALSFFLQDDQATLRDEQIEAAMQRIWQAIERKYHATLR